MPENDWLSRTELLIGEQALRILKASSVAVFGVGGVGSFAAEALARSGIGRLILIDNDKISASNINRQIHALRSTVGLFKTEAMKNRIADINPYAVVETRQVFYLPGTAGFPWNYDYVIDAVDTVTAKLEIILEAKKRDIPIISAMGAGNKLDPTKMEIADIYETSICPLARVMRRELRKRGVDSLKVVYSKELPVAAACSWYGSAGEPDPKQTPDLSFPARRGVPGSIAFVPSVMGLIIAGEVIRELIRLNSE